MDKKMMYIVVGVVAIVAIAAIAFVAMGNGGNAPVVQDGDKNKADFTKQWTEINYKDGDVTWPARLLVLGNADLDDKLDQNDINAIKKLIGTKYNYTDKEVFMADTNFDGIIDQKDIDMLTEMIDYKNYKGIVNYFDCDFKIATYDMSKPVKTSNILTQTLEMLCILYPESVIAVDDRCANSQVVGAAPQGGYWKEYAAVLDYSKLGSVGSHKAPSVERYLEVARTYGDGYLTAVMNATDAYATGYLEKGLAGTNVQVIRCPSWERAGVDQGMLLLGYLFHKYDRATEWVAWHDKYYNEMMDKVSKLSESQRKKVVVGVLGDTDVAIADDIELNYTTSAEWQGIKRMGIIDVGGDYLKTHSTSGAGYGSWSEHITKESMINLIAEAGGLDVFVGTIPGPFNVGNLEQGKPTPETYMSSITSFLSQYSPETVLQVIGWQWTSGPMELVYYATIGNLLYGWEYDVETIINEGLQWIGNYGDDKDNYKWCYNNIKEYVLYPN